ncbi:MAG: helix-turn-helix domain-containing protein [Treponema sp.]
MERKSLSRMDVYKEVNLSENTFSTWLKRGTVPRADILLKIANCVGVSVQWLLTGKELDGLSQEEHDLIENYRVLDSSMQQLVQLQLEILADKSNLLRKR